MPLARRSHRKVRTGCFGCKRRRIECDERRPTCRNCIQHRIECTYPGVPLRAPGTPVESREISPDGGRSSSADSQAQGSLHREDLTMVRLMHYFAIYTCQTLSSKREVQALWRCQVPKLAFDHHYLLQMIFAVTALHISRRNPLEAHYLPYAYQQYEMSLRNSSLSLSQLSPENCHALYAVSVLAFVFELGTLHYRESLINNRNGSLADWIVHSRGVHAIIGSSWHHLTTGCLKQMFECEFTSKVPAKFELCLKEVVTHARSCPFPEGILQAYLQAVDELLKWSKLENLGFYGWLCQFPDKYGELLARKEPYALIILGYSSVLLKYGEPKYWIDEWAERLLREIYGSLNTSLRIYLDWPMEELGLVKR